VGVLTVTVAALGLPEFRLAVFTIAVIAMLPAIVRLTFPNIRKWRYWDSALIVALAIAVATAGVALTGKIMGADAASAKSQPNSRTEGSQPTGDVKHPTPTDTVISSTPPPQPGCAKKLAITSPIQGAFIADGDSGVVIRGQACDLSSESGWLFELDSQDGYYYDDYNTDKPTPVVPEGFNGSWSFDDSPIGDSGDSRKLYTLTLVLASPTCDKALRAIPSIDGDYKMRAFPAICKVESSVEVYVSSP
jgi:hypothetical protein